MRVQKKWWSVPLAPLAPSLGAFLAPLAVFAFTWSNCAMAEEPNFDCKFAKNFAEKAICADQDDPNGLAALDRQLADEYQFVLSGIDGTDMRTAYVGVQREWLKERNACQSKDCLRKLMEFRLDDFRALRETWDWEVRNKQVRAKPAVRSVLLDGKGVPLCEELLKLARRRFAPTDGMKTLIPWQQVLAIDGVQEPAWKILDPAQYEPIFLDAKKNYQSLGQTVEPGYSRFEQWFEPSVGKSFYRASMEPKEKRPPRVAALDTYRDFVRRGGKLKLVTVRVATYDFPILQYETPESDQVWWDGLTLLANENLDKADQRGFGTNNYGLKRRLLLFQGQPYTFFSYYDEYTVYPLNYEGGCRINMGSTETN